MIEKHSEPGGETFPTGNRPIYGRVRKLPCGCSCDDTRWLTYCRAARDETSAIAAAWQHDDNMRKAAAARDPLLE